MLTVTPLNRAVLRVTKKRFVISPIQSSARPMITQAAAPVVLS